MFLFLVIIASMAGLFTLSSLGVGIGYIVFVRADNAQQREQIRRHRLERLFGRWTWFDYCILVIFLLGFVFLIVDLAAVIRDRELYPIYHYGYLASGFIFTLMSMLLLYTRLGMVIALHRSSDTPAKHHQ